jgi:hypothetical protein
MVKDDERYLSDRKNEKKWERYLAPGESAEDTDDEKEEQQEEKYQEPVLSLEPALEIPELEHNSPISEVTPEPPRKALSLFIPEPDEESDVEEANDTFMSKNFNIVEFEGLREYNDCALSKEELKKLSKGENININNEYYDKISKDSTVKKITFPNGYSICIKNKKFV